MAAPSLQHINSVAVCSTNCLPVVPATVIIKRSATMQFDYRTYENALDYETELHVLLTPRCVVTTAVCTVRKTLSTRSTKVCDLPVGTPLYVECIYKQRACIHTSVDGVDVYGWCWLSSRNGDLVKIPSVSCVNATGDEHFAVFPSTSVMTPPVNLCTDTFSPGPSSNTPVEPTVVWSSPLVNNSDVQTLCDHLCFYGVPITKIKWVDTKTVEIELSSHRDGILAINWVRKVNGKPIELAWKSSYLEYRKLSSFNVYIFTNGI